MKLGIWTPAPITIRADETILDAFAGLSSRGGSGKDPAYKFAVETVQRAEQLGFDITLIAERFSGPDLEAWLLSAALAAETDRIQIMTAVHPGIISPQMAAKFGASMDRISGGRFVVNVVNGARKHEFDLFGEWLDMESPRYRRMDEFLQIMKAFWTQDEVNFNGEFYTIENGVPFLRPQQTPFPPIYAASRNPDGMEIVARHCDTWFCSYHNDFRMFDQSIEKVAADIQAMEKRVSALGRKMSYGVSGLIITGASDAEANERAAEYEQHCRQNNTRTAAVPLSAGLVGTTETVINRIKLYQSIGVDMLMLHFWPMRAGLEEFARDIMPEIRSLRVQQSGSLAMIG